MKIKLEKTHIQWGTTAFIVIVLSVLVLFAILRIETVMLALSKVHAIFAPFIWGFVIAYLLCPIYNFVVRFTFKKLHSKGKSNVRVLAVAKFAGTFISMTLLIVAIAGVSWMIIPGLYDSVINIVDQLPLWKDASLVWVQEKLVNFPIAEEKIARSITNSADNLIKFATESFLPHYSTIAVGISSSIIGAFTILKNAFIGIIISVYFLNGKDVFAAQAKKLLFAILPEKNAEGGLELVRFINKAFGGFISGKIIDSIIIGIICFIVMMAFNWEYALLISCIIGITNVIPFFGPFIGGIPSTLLLVMVNPTHAIYFAIFVILLQQFDGNILGPKILGDSTGLASFWVLFAVLVGGGLFGFVGMLVGIPVFAVIYFYGTRFINEKLEKKGYSSHLVDYKIDSYRTTNKGMLKPKGIMKIFVSRKKRKLEDEFHEDLDEPETIDEGIENE